MLANSQNKDINQGKNSKEKDFSFPRSLSNISKNLTFIMSNFLVKKKAQSALEYMMTYGWAILIIVIVAVILYSMGIFNPSSNISATITGFSATPVSNAICTSNGVLRLTVGDTTGHRILIKNISATSNGKIEVFTPTSTVDPNPIITQGNIYTFSISNVCPPAGSHFSTNVNINYTEPTTAFPNAEYTSSGAVTGTVSSTVLPSVAAYFNGNAYPIFGSCGYANCFITQGANTYINATNPLPGVNKSYTLVLWALDTGIFNENYNSSIAAGSGRGGNGNDSNGLFAFSPGVYGYQDLGVSSFNNGREGPGLHRCEDSDTWLNVPTDFFNGQWHFVAVSVDKPNYIFELDGNQYTISNSNEFSSGSLMAIGPYAFYRCDEGPFNGYIVNVQLYNGSLSASQLKNLYNEGIAGKPLSVSNAPLIGWWPLNGTVNGMAKDYAGTSNGNFINSYITSNYQS
ncbi:MAG: LamG-like jellyroll fold domain-containing protein [Candidatus Parvarchaeum sp.]